MKNFLSGILNISKLNLLGNIYTRIYIYILSAISNYDFTFGRLQRICMDGLIILFKS